jgi:hypothetical protein
VDPDVQSTGTPYAYVLDNPISKVDALGLDTLGFCGSGTFGFSVGFAQAGLDICLTRTIDRSGEDDIGLTGTLFGTVGSFVSVNALQAPGAGALSFGAGFTVSNASNLRSLRGWFYTATLFVGLVSATVFTSPDGKIFGVSVQRNTAASVGVGVGASFTVVLHFQSSFIANPARWLWDGIADAASVGWFHWLNFARHHKPTKDHGTVNLYT